MSSNNDHQDATLTSPELGSFLNSSSKKHLGVCSGDSLNVFMTTYMLNYAKLSTTSFEKTFLFVGNVSQGSNHPNVLKLED